MTKEAPVRRLRLSKKKWVLIELGACVFTLAGFLMIRSGEQSGWFVLPVFLISSVFIPFGYFMAELRLEKKGFYVKNLSKTHFVSWSEVSSFFTVSISPNVTVGFDFKNEVKPHQLASTLSKELSGADYCLVDTYGLTAPGLVQLVEQYRITHK